MFHKPTLGGWFSAVGLATFFIVSSQAQQLDSYGGSMQITCSGGKQAHFYAEKVGNRWWLCTPEGQGFFLKGIYNAAATDTATDYQGMALANVIAQKYATGPTTDSTLNWAAQTLNRMQAWGFNTLSENSSPSTWPVTMDARWKTPDQTPPTHMPFVTIVRPSWYSFTNAGNWANGPVKDLIAGVKQSVYSGYRSHSSDFWDPNFQQWFAASFTNDPVTHSAYTGPNNSYLIGFDIDETDNLEGFGAGPDFSTADISIAGTSEAGHATPHLGWIVLVTASTQSSNEGFGVTYSDTRVYSKQAMSDWLSARYGGNIATLNAAWGSRYTTFGSAGGWGSGSGILDEDGTCPARGGGRCWVPTDAVGLSGATPGMMKDLDDFLLYHAQKYYAIVKETVSAQAPGFLILGSSPIGAWGAPPRRQVLQAASQYLDVYTLGNIPPFMCKDCNDVQQRIDFVAQYGGDKPWLNWEGFQAKADSYYSITASRRDALQTQAQRGDMYKQMVDGMLNAKDSNTGTYHVVGFQWRDMYDSRSEQSNWGLITPRDNPYDGSSAVIAAGKDPWGYPTGGEQADYGNFLTPVIAANASVYGTPPGSTPSSGLKSHASQPDATSTISSSANPASTGQSITFTMKVTGSGPTPTGNVQLYDAGQWMAWIMLNGGTASFTTTALSAGTHSIVVVYSGDSNYSASSSAPFTQTVSSASAPNSQGASVTVSSTENPASPGQAVTFTANVTGSGPTPTGTVEFFDGGQWLAWTRLSGGSSSFTTTTLSAGTHSIRANYSGDSNYPASSSAAYTQTISGSTSTPAGSTGHGVTLTWFSSTSPNVSGYNLYRGSAPNGPFTKVNSSLLNGQSYFDADVQAGQTYYYVATAVDGSGAESSYSTAASATVPTP